MSITNLIKKIKEIFKLVIFNFLKKLKKYICKNNKNSSLNNSRNNSISSSNNNKKDKIRK